MLQKWFSIPVEPNTLVEHGGKTYRSKCYTAAEPGDSPDWALEGLSQSSAVVLVKGDKGDKGDCGLRGTDGAAGRDGRDGLDGKDGKAGLDAPRIAEIVATDNSLTVYFNDGHAKEVPLVVDTPPDSTPIKYYKGFHNPDAAYSVGDVVKVGASVYLCTNPPAKGSLSLDNWTLLTSPAGRSGGGSGGVAGPAGPKGDKGDKGDVGPAGPPGAGTGTLRLPKYTVATLPSAATEGDMAFVTDSLGRTLDGAVHEGGSSSVVVWFDGTNWKQT
jgi:hypothetical protein